MIEQLFGSKTRVKLLKLFYSNPNRSYYVREITRTIDEQINSVRRELANLLSIGIISSDSTNNKLYYEVNQKFEHYDALGSIFGSGKVKPKKATKKSKAEPTKDAAVQNEQPESVELEEAKRWKTTGNVAGVAYSGVYTRDAQSVIDIVVIGDVVISKVEQVIKDLEKEKNTDLRYAVIDTKEWSYRRQVHDKFWLQIMDSKLQIVLDTNQIFKN